MNNISPKVQNQVAMLQQIQQQLQTILSQKAQYEMAAREAKRAQEEIKDIPEDTAMYMSVGSVMMQKKKDVVNTKAGREGGDTRTSHQVIGKAGEDAAGQIRAAAGADQGGTRRQECTERSVIIFDFFDF